MHPSDVHHVVVTVVCCVCTSLSLFSLLHLTKRPLFILFCQQPKRRGECPPNAIIQSTPLKDIHASYFRKLTISVLAIPNLLPFPFFFLFLFYSLFPLCSIAKPLPPGTNVSTGRTACSFCADICSVSDRRQPTRFRASRKDQLDKRDVTSTNRRRSAKCGAPPQPFSGTNMRKVVRFKRTLDSLL